MFIDILQTFGIFLIVLVLALIMKRAPNLCKKAGAIELDLYNRLGVGKSRSRNAVDFRMIFSEGDADSLQIEISSELLRRLSTTNSVPTISDLESRLLYMGGIDRMGFEFTVINGSDGKAIRTTSFRIDLRKDPKLGWEKDLLPTIRAILKTHFNLNTTRVA